MLTKKEVRKLMEPILNRYDMGIIGRFGCINQSLEKCYAADPDSPIEACAAIIREIMKEGDVGEDIVAEEKLDLDDDELESEYLDRP